MKRNNILAKKRLMRTTTYLTALLVAATMILSSSSVMAVDFNAESTKIDNGGDLAPLSSGNGFDMAAGDDPVVSPVEYGKGDNVNPFRGGVVIYDNDMSYYNLIPSWINTPIGNDQIAADDFIFPAGDDVPVHGVHWFMALIGTGIHHDWDMRVEFFEDAGGLPGASFAGPFDTAWADLELVSSPAPAGREYWYMSCDIPETFFDADTTYWVAIYALGDYSVCKTYIGHHAAPIKGSMGAEYSDYFWGGWDTIFGIYGIVADMAFQLTQKASHDVFVDEILAPTDVSAFCPCTPVEVTVSNAGANDETDVPVSVEIRRYTMQDSFEDPFGLFWDPIPGGNVWMQSMFEMAYPWIVTPRTGMYMAELDSGMTGPGNAWLDSLPIDLTGYCHPMMSFYMWHDEYGSDDFIDVQVNFADVAGPFTRLCCPDCPTGWMEHVVDLSAYVDTSIILGFEGNCDSNPGAYNLQIDDVSIYDQEYYEEQDVDVDAGQTVAVEFPEWCPCHWQDPAWADTSFDIEVVACTHLGTDEVTANDCEIEVVTMYMPFEHDVAAISIDEPVDNVVPIDTFEMCGTIKNVGQYQECCFSVYMTVEEQYTIPGIPPTPDTIYLGEDFSTWIPAGWMTNTFDQSFTSNAGGTSPEARLYWLYASGVDYLVSPAVNTVGAASLELEFKSFVDYYTAGAISCTVRVTDGVGGWVDVTPWPNPIMTNQGPATYNIDITGFIGPGTQVEFEMVGYYWDIDYWFIDDVIIKEPGDPGTPDTYDYYAPEYEDSYCIDDIDVCEEIQICFEDWTPAGPYPDCGEKTYRICLETRLCDPPDENPLNDMTCELITVEFWHDVAIREITSPADADRDIWYAVNDQAYPTYNYVSFDSSTPGTTTVIGPYSSANFPQGACFVGDTYWCTDTTGIIYTVDLGTGIGTLVGNAGTGELIALAYDPTTSTLYGASTTNLYTINQGTGVANLVGSFGYIPGPGWMITIDCDKDGNMYGYNIDVTGGAILFSIDTGTGAATQIGPIGFYSNYGQDMSFDKDAGVLYACAYDTSGKLYSIDTSTGVGTFLGALAGQTTCFAIPYTAGPSINLWVPCGEQDFCATFENLGTFDEPACTIDWVLNEYNTDPVVPTYVIGGSEPISLDIGDVLEDYCFASYDFVDDGFYELIVEINAPVDCYPDNNGPLDIGIGVDCCPPESTFVLDPEQPNGENNWYTTDVTATVDAVDCCDPPHLGSGVKEIKYLVDGEEGSITGDHGTIPIEEDGVHLVELWAIDLAGNEEEEHHTFEVAIDGNDPIVDFSYEAYEADDGWHVDFDAQVSDGTSGIDKVEFYIGSSLDSTLTEAPFTWSFAWEEGFADEKFKVTAYDNAGNSHSEEIDGGGIEAQPYFNSQPTVPVWLVQKQTNSL